MPSRREREHGRAGADACDACKRGRMRSTARCFASTGAFGESSEGRVRGRVAHSARRRTPGEREAGVAQARAAWRRSERVLKLRGFLNCEGSKTARVLKLRGFLN